MSESGSTNVRKWPKWWRRALVSARRANIFGVLELVCVITLAVMLVWSWVLLSDPPEPNELVPPLVAATLLIGTLIPAMALLVLIGRRMAIHRAGATTARLHVRLVFFFSIVSAVPTLLVAIFASVLFQSGVAFWFSDTSRGVLENANQLARIYYDQNQRDLANETIAMADDMRSYLNPESTIPRDFEAYYRFQLTGRDLAQSSLLQKSENGNLITLAIAQEDIEGPSITEQLDGGQSGEPTIESTVPADALQRVDAGEQVVVWIEGTRIMGLTPVDREDSIYLFNTRTSENLPLSGAVLAGRVLDDYDRVTVGARSLQLRFNLALFLVSLGLVGLAIWFALRFADRQVKPLTDLVNVAREVGKGNYSLRVEGRTGPDEIGLLNRAFNRMTSQIEQQTTELVSANEQIERRRAFIEAVLESITAGIVSVRSDGEVLLMNTSAQKLLLPPDDPSPPLGLRLPEIAPDLAALMDAGVSNGNVQYNKDGELLTLAVKLSPAQDGCVITFEDITRQLLDQRQAAWSDVARRIAHEIKNPLTPIQLATERLNRRYLRQIEKDADLFQELTSTIIRQVGDLRKMVDEFSSFARLPKPVFRQEDGVDLVRQNLFLQEVAHPEVDYSLAIDPDIAAIACDRHQFGQAMTNVLKNAGEAVEARTRDAGADYRGQIKVHVSQDDAMFTVTVDDNGVGLPQDKDRIVEPYVTTREKGTGLGLAIVNKIVEEHGGDMGFSPASGGGTRVTLRFARNPLSTEKHSEAAE